MTTIKPLTTTILGFAAVHYSCATSVTLHRAEVRLHGGHVEPPRIVTADEAHALMRHNQAECGVISCTATHGELPYRLIGPLEIDWRAIHAAALVVDVERHAVGCLGHDGISDAFGGSCFPPGYEGEGLAGVVRILAGAQTIRHAAWDAIHKAHRVPHGQDLAACGLRTALALDRLFRALAAVGVYRYDPLTQICGVTGYEPTDTVQVTGLRWLAGATSEREDEKPTMQDVATFLDNRGARASRGLLAAGACL